MIDYESNLGDGSKVIDDVHRLVEGLRGVDAHGDLLDDLGIDILKIAVHEWIANLVQHADFSGREPTVRLEVTKVEGRVRCRIIDNSKGFDFASQLLNQQRELEVSHLPPDRGRGLLLIIACTEDIAYRTLQRNRADGAGPSQCLQFWLAPTDANGTHPVGASAGVAIRPAVIH